MAVTRSESSESRRIIAHVDMDCFYVQVEQRKQPELRGLPTAVVQYNEWKGGALIAVGYEARKFGVTRHMRGDEANEVCPQIHLVQVPVSRGKADLSAYRNAGSEVVSILARKGRCERASIDEVYLDLTDSAEAMLSKTPPESLENIHEEALKSHILGLKIESGADGKEKVREWLSRSDADHCDKLLACGAIIVANLRMQVLKETEFTCSAGIAHNKMLAKLASPMNKPAQQTVIPHSSVKELLDSLPIKKMKHLGGKLGSSLQTDLGVCTVGDLLQFSEEKLQDHYGVNKGTWLWNIARGICVEEVQRRLLPQSHGSGKSFPGPRALKTTASVQHWLNQLCEELNDRLCGDLEQNKRIARTLTLHTSAYKSSDADSQRKFPSKSCPLRNGTAKIQEDAFNLFQAGLREYLGVYGVKTQGMNNNGWGITSLSISATKIEAIPSGTSSIMKYFHGSHLSDSSEQTPDKLTEEVAPLSPSGNDAHLELKSSEPQNEYDVPIFDRQQEKIIAYNNQESICSSPEQSHGGFAQEASPSFSCGFDSGSKTDTTLNKSKVVSHNPHGLLLGNAHDIKLTPNNLEKKNGKRNAIKEKGTILSFFQSCDSLKAENLKGVEGAWLCNPDKRLNSNSDLQETTDGCPLGNQVEHQGAYSGAWNLKIDEIDPSVIDELPPEIQREIREWMQPHKRLNTVKQGYTITNYFSPANNT